MKYAHHMSQNGNPIWMPPITIGSIPIGRQIGPPGAVPIIRVEATTPKGLHSWHICPFCCHLHSQETGLVCQ